MIIGMISPETVRQRKPQVMNMLCKPLCWIQGWIANGMPMLTALRRNAIPVKASPVT
jgi:hypothetical protein